MTVVTRSEQNRIDDAEAQYSKALGIFQSAFGSNHDEGKETNDE